MAKILQQAGLISQIGHPDSTSGKLRVTLPDRRKITFSKKSQIFKFADGHRSIQDQLRSKYPYLQDTVAVSTLSLPTLSYLWLLLNPTTIYRMNLSFTS